MQGSGGAKRGFKRETYFCELVNKEEKFNIQLRSALDELDIIKGEITFAKDVKSSQKSDVVISIQADSLQEVGCSMKSAELNFNQLDRRWLDDMANSLDMPINIKEEIQSSIERKIINSRDILITAEQEELIIPFFESKKDIILKELFTRSDENLELFIVYNEIKNEWSIAKIKDIIDFLMNERITRTPRGVIYFGDCLSMQRKGGDGNVKNPPKSSPSHPSNQLQFKIKPLSIIEKVKSITIKDNAYTK